MRRIFFTVALAMTGSLLFAGGYKLSLQGVRQAAMGGNGSTSFADASVAFYNPAGLAFVDSKLSIAAGGFGISNTVKWQDPKTLASAETDNPLGTPFYFAASYKPIDDLAIAVSVSSPFGSTVEWPKDWPNRANVTSIELQGILFQPTVAYKFNEWFSIGGGFIYALGKVNLQRVQNVAGNEIGLEIDSKDAYGSAFNLGTVIKPWPKMTVSLAYRSQVDMKARRGKTKWSDVPPALSTNANFNTNKFNATLPLPSEFLAGISYKFTNRFTLSGEISVQGWSRYKHLDIQLFNDETGYSTTSSSDKYFKNSRVYRIGGEYFATDNLALRLGYYYDQSPVRGQYWSSETPSTTQHGITGGLGYKFGSFNIDASVQYNYGEERKIYNVNDKFSGEVLTRAWIFGVGVSYNLKK